METKDIDWKSLEFTCVKEKAHNFDAEADGWYKTARNLQDKDEDKYAKFIVELYEKAIAKNHHNAMHRLAMMYVEGAEGIFWTRLNNLAGCLLN